jgi:hypothetical protein
MLLGGAVPAGWTGTRASTFTFLDPGVRAGALGGAYTALGGEPTALYWNPATLYYLRGRSVEASYADLYGLGLARRTFITYGQKSMVEEPRYENNRIVVQKDPVTGPAYAVGLQSLFLDLDENGYSELSLGGAAAWGYGDRVSVGLAVRTLFISSDLDEVSAFGYNLGLGLAWQYSRKERIGLAVPNLLSRVFWKFDSTERLPLGLSLGWNRTFSDRFLVAADLEWRESETGPYRVGVGAEYWAVVNRMVVRGGFRHLSGDFEDQNKPTFGAGVTVSRIRLDYGFRLGPEALGDTHRLGVLVGF